MRLARLLLLLLAAFMIMGGVGGCFAVMQWQRQYLGDQIMQFDRDAKQGELNNHIFPRREGSSGGDGGAGGGCGC
jgi:hypothetical protein